MPPPHEPVRPGRQRAPVWPRVAGIGFVATAFLFLGYLVVGNVGALRAHDWTIRPGLLVLSLALYIAGLFWGVWVWRALLGRLGYEVRLPALARIWFVSGLGKYIPGKIWQFVGAAQMGPKAGVPASATVTSLAAHTGFFLLAALLVAIYLLPANAVGAVGEVALGTLRWIAPVTILTVHPAVVRAVLAFVRKVIRRDLGQWDGRWSDGILLLALASVGWLITGSALYLFLLSLTPLPLSAALAVIGINAASFAVGYLVFFVPAGLGAKEGVLAALLTLFVPAPVAALLAMAARLWSVAAEVLPAVALLRLSGPTVLTTSTGEESDR